MNDRLLNSTEIREMNQVVRRTDEQGTGVTAASVFALWLLIPLALGGLAYVFVGLWTAKSELGPDTSFDTRIWIAMTLLLQTGYWMLLAKSLGVSMARGLWGLIPVVALIPTMRLARAAARR